MNILFVCDRKACPNCHYPDCEHTTDPDHAVNFKKEVHVQKNEAFVYYYEQNKKPETNNLEDNTK